MNNIIKQVEVKNFQSWEYGIFDLDPGVNIFLGESDKGKSAVFRGIEWVRTNSPLGDEFCSDWIKPKKKHSKWKGSTEVTIRFSDNSFITRSKKGIENQYILSTLKEPLKAFGKEVPQEVTDFLNMSDVNVQTQDRQHFLLDESPSEIGRKLNQVASLSDIDKAFTNVNSKIKTLNADIKKDEKDLKIQHEEIETFEWIGNADKDLKKLEALQGMLQGLREKERVLRNSNNKIQELKTELKSLNKIVKYEKQVNRLILNYKQYQELKEKYNIFVDREEKIINSENTIKEINKIILHENKIKCLIKNYESYKKLKEKYSVLLVKRKTVQDHQKKLDDVNKIIKFESKVKDLIQSYKNYDELKGKYNILVRQEEKIVNTQKTVDVLDIEIVDLEQKYNELKPDTCPLCKQEWRK